jgi:glycosyltransferase involved in cell wall biosynthesis
MVRLANLIAKEGHPTDLVLGSAWGPFLDEVSDQVRIVDLGARRVAKCLPALTAYLRRVQPEAMLSALGHANVTALLARRLSGGSTRLVVSERASFVGGVQNARTLKSRLVRLAMRLTYREADAVIAVAEAMVPELVDRLGLDPAKVFSAPNPVVTSDLHLKAAATPPHPWMQEAVPVILAAGRLAPEKDFAGLVRAFARLSAPVRLVILGEGPERPRLEALVARLGLGERVALPGFDPNPYAYMKRARLFVLSSLYEGLPGVLIQAMACGCPVVATDCRTGPREILEDGRWGDLVPVGDVTALAAAMAAVLSRDVHPDVHRRAADYGEAAAVRRYLDVLLPS